jgi:T1SS-143 domain-containing protein
MGHLGERFMATDTTNITTNNAAATLQEGDIDQGHLTQSGNSPVPIQVPQGEKVVRIQVTPGETLQLPFPSEGLVARLGDNGNLAVKVGDVTVILLGYAEATGQSEVTIIGNDGQPVDVAAVLAATDPNIDIQTAAGPGAGDQGAGPDNNGGLFSPFDPTAGIGGLNAIGGLNPTALNYNLVDREFPELIEDDEVDTVPSLLNVRQGAVINEDDLHSRIEELTSFKLAPDKDPNYQEQIGDELAAKLNIGDAKTGGVQGEGNDEFDLDDHEEESQNGNDPADEDNGQGVDIDREPLTSTAVVSVDFHADVPGTISFQNGASIPLQTQLEAMNLTSHGHELQYKLLPAVADSVPGAGDGHGEVLVAYYITPGWYDAGEGNWQYGDVATIVFSVGVREPELATAPAEFNVDFTIYGVIDNAAGTADADGDISDMFDIDVPFFMVDSDGSVTPSPTDALTFHSVDDVPSLGSVGDNGEEGGYQLVLTPADTNITHDETDGLQSGVGPQAGDPDSSKEVPGQDGEDDVSTQNYGVYKALQAAGLGEVSPIGAAQTWLDVSFGADGPAGGEGNDQLGLGNKEAGYTVFTGDGAAYATAFQLYIGDADASLTAGATNWTVMIDGVEVTVRAEQINANTIVGYANKGDVDGDGIPDNQQGGDAIQAAVPDADMPVFVLYLDPQSGELTLVQLHQVNQDDAANADDATPPLAICGEDGESANDINFRGTDFDGDHVDASLNIQIQDDGPKICGVTYDTPLLGIVDEDKLSGGIEGGPLDIGAFGASVGGKILVQPGADQPVTFSFADASGQVYVSGLALPPVFALTDVAGNPVTLVVDNAGSPATLSGVADGVTMFTVTLDKSTGEFTFTLFHPVEHPSDGNPFGAGSFEDSLLTLGFGVKVTDADGDSDTTQLYFKINDDTPEIAGISPTNETPSSDGYLLVDEDFIAGGNQDQGSAGKDANGGNIATGQINFGTGADGGSISLTAGDGWLKNSSGSNVLASETGNKIWADREGNVIVGHDGGPDGPVVFTLTLNADGSFAFELVKALKHEAGDQENSQDIKLNFDVVVVDNDGDSVSTKIKIKIDDDMPRVTNATVVGIVEEEALTPANSGGHAQGNQEAGDAEPDTAVATGSLTSLVSIGADQPGNWAFKSGGGVFAGLIAQNLTSGGTALSYAWNNGVLEAKAAGVLVFTLSLTSDGKYTFTLLDHLDHQAGNGENGVSIDFSSLVAVSDKDGDTIGLPASAFSVNVVDDVPIANDDHQFMKESQHTITGNVLAGDTNDADTVTDQPGQQDQVGADDPGRVSQVHSINLGGSNVAIDTGDKTLDGDSTVVQGQYGKLTINEDGTYSYSLDPAFDIDTLTADPVHVGRSGTGGQATDWTAQGLIITATKFDGSQGTVQYDSNGIGVSGTKPGLQVPGQIGYDPNSQTSEALTLTFGCPVNSATVKVSNLFKDENDGEQGTWKAYDANGNLIAQGLFGPGANNPATGYIHVDYGNSNNVGTFEIGVDDTNGASIARIEFGATEYGPNNNAGNPSSDSSDYYIREVTYVPAVVQEHFEYTLTDTDGDTDTAVLTIDVCDNVPSPRAGSASGLVTEDVLAGGSGEDPASAPASAIFNGNLPIYNGTVSNLVFDDPSSSLDGAPVKTEDANTITLTMAGEWTMVIVKATGAFTFTLLDEQQHGDATKVFADDTLLGKFVATVSGSGGADATGTISIIVNDDGPVARVDTDNVANLQTTDGNVLTGLGTDGGLGGAGADTKGADGAVVSAVRQNPAYGNSFDNDGSNGFTVSGQYGSLTMNPDGSYIYTRYGNGPLDAVDHFEYTLKDGDGDLSTATLDITISDKDSSLDVPTAGEAGTKVYEAGLPEGSAETSDGVPNNDNSEKTSGTINFATPDGFGSLTIKGVPVVAGATIPGAFGTLHIDSVDTATGVLTYTYTLNGKTNGDTIHDDFPVVVTDSDGDAKSLTLVVDIIDDVPTARDDADSVANLQSTTGNVITGLGTAGGEGGSGADTKGADGAKVTAIASQNEASHASSALPDTGHGVGQSIVGQYGTLNIYADGYYTYTRLTDAPLQAVDSFTYTLTDGDGDSDPATLAITIKDRDVEIDLPVDGEGGTLVYEKGLPAGSGETADPAANSDESEVTYGEIHFNAPDGINTIIVSGMQFGFFEVVDFNAVTNVLQYKYTLTTPTNGEDTHEVLTVYIVDNDGDNKTAQLVIDIIDDVPTARDDADSVANLQSTTGNVITGLGTAGGEGGSGADTKGADGAKVTAIASQNEASHASSALPDTGHGVGQSIVGQYGTLNIYADGYYTYTRLTDAPLQAVDSFTYTLTDGDGDSDPATLAITIKDRDVEIDLPVDGEGGTLVYEKGLPAGSGETADPAANSDESEVTYGEIHFNAPDGINTIIVSGMQFGFFEVVDFNAVTNVLQYKYTLTTPTNGEDTHEVLTVYIADNDGDTKTAQLVIDIIDDVPTARDDADSVAEGLGNQATGNVITGLDTTNPSAGADTKGADGASVSGLSGYNGSVDNDATGGFTVNGQYGTLVMQPNGSYIYTLTVPSVPAGKQDVFTYTLTDGDGDSDPATLTINIDQDTRIPTVANSQVLVDEEGLADGSAAAGNSETGSSSFFINTNNEGLSALSIGGAAVNLVAGYPQTLIDNAGGKLVVTGIVPSGTGFTVNYTYTLADNVLTHGTQGKDDTANGPTFAVVATDATGDSNVTGSVQVVISDDAPTARSDVDSVGN